MSDASEPPADVEVSETDLNNEFDLSIVIPVFNEQESIEQVLRSIEDHVSTPHETLVVYDYDEDPTVPVVEKLSHELSSIRLLRNDLGRGALLAIRSGMQSARGKFVLVTMADGSDEHSVVESMLELAHRGAAVVAASRYVKGGSQVGGPKVKALASRSAGLLLHYIGGLSIYDPTNNFKLYERSFLESTSIQSTRGFELALELTVKAYGLGLQLDEVPTTWYCRTSGESQWDARTLLPGYLRWFLLGMSYRLPKITQVFNERSRPTLERDSNIANEHR